MSHTFFKLLLNFGNSR